MTGIEVVSGADFTGMRVPLVKKVSVNIFR